MKVVQISQSYYPRPGGVTEHVEHVSRELRRRGHEVTIVTSNFGNRRRTDDGVVRLGKNILLPINGAWVNTTIGWNLQRDLSRVFRALQPDIIHTHCPLVPTLPLMSLTTAPESCRVLGTFHAAAERSLGYQLFRDPLRKLAARLDTRIAVSEAARALALSYFPSDYVIVPNGVDCHRFSPRHEPLESFTDDAFNILFVGRMDKRKGLKYLFRAVTLASRRTSRRLRLIVVGDDGFRRHLLPTPPSRVEVVFTGVVDRDLLPRYFASGHMFCSPATDRESFGIVLLEAMASGLPIVGTAIQGYLTILRDQWNALVVPPREPLPLCDAILRLVEDETLRWKLRNNGLALADTYRWERVVDRLEAVYHQEDDITASWRSVANPLVADSAQARAQKV
jgi:phosphatidylinositol alpha-mannosyltransferase